jgi:hypothetical protein
VDSSPMDRSQFGEVPANPASSVMVPATAADDYWK